MDDLSKTCRFEKISQEMLAEAEDHRIRGYVLEIRDEVLRTGGDPIRQLEGYLSSRDPTYLPPKVRKYAKYLEPWDVLTIMVAEYIRNFTASEV